MQTLRKRGQIRDVSGEAIADLKALEQRSEERLGRDRDEEEATR
ncbi:NADH:ubiquinone oxidoreductase subunit J [Streptomyces narbonensis]